MRIIAVFEKSAELKYVSHLDMMRSMQRSLRKAELPIKYSAGFNPHPLLSFGPALSVGISGDAELMDVSVEDISEDEFMSKLAPRMGGFILKEAHAVADSYPALMKICEYSDYVITLNNSLNSKDQLEGQLESVFEQPLLADKKGKAGVKEVDLRGFIRDYCVDTKSELFFRLRSAVDGALNPNLLMSALELKIGISSDEIRRTALWATKDNELITLWSAGQ